MSADASARMQQDALELPTASAAASTAAARDAGFAINGRFYSQATTGVQRYGREILLAMDALLEGSGRQASLILPPGAEAVPAFAAIRSVQRGPLSGHGWEQAVLPFSMRRPLLNLCNTGPVLGRRQVVCIHDANVHTDPGSYSASFRRLYRFLQPQLIRGGARLTTVSHFSRALLARHLPVAGHSITVVPNGHEHVFRWNAAASRWKADLADTRPYVLLLGSRARHKNATLILGLAEALDGLGLDLRIAGGSAGIFAETPSGTPPNVHRLGYVSDDDLAALYAQAFCLAFPSRVEGFGLPIVEAMALGCPVISSDAASMPEVCGEAALLAPPDNPAAWLRHVTALRHSTTLRGELCQRGRQQARRFSWTESARIYLDLLERSA